MMWLKKIEETKCPWCGNILSDECCEKTCSNRIIYYVSLDVGVFILIGTIILLLIEIKTYNGSHLHMHEGYFVCGAFIIIVLLTQNYYPVFKKGERKCASEPLLGRATVKWYTLRKGGIGLPRLRLVNNMIFPVCFVDKEGKPVSQTMLVRIRKKFGFFWTGAKVHLAVTDKFWTKDKNGKDPWERAEKMVIFNNREIVGEAKLKKRC